MIRATRRGALAAGLALPAAASLARSPTRKPSGTVLLHDPSLEAGRRFASSAQARGAKALPIEGDRIRFARGVFKDAPALVVGVSRAADAVLIEDVGREEGYKPVPVPPTLARIAEEASARSWALAPRA